MHVERSRAAGPGGRIAYLVWEEESREALLVDWDELVLELAEVVAREELVPRWHARTDAQQPPADVEAGLAAAFPGLHTAWYAGCGTLRIGALRVDLVWTPRGGGDGTGAGDDEGVAGLSFVVDERAAFVGGLVAAAEARDERAARSLEVVREFASEATLYPGM